MKINELQIDARAFRAMRGLRTQKQWGDLLGMSGVYLSMIERGHNRPSGPQLLRALLISGADPWSLVPKDQQADIRALVEAAREDE